MTYPQYSNLISFLANKLNWDIQVACSPMSGEISEDLNPLLTFKNSEEEKEHKKLLTMEDIENLKNIV